jgi:hypothetical protein
MTAADWKYVLRQGILPQLGRGQLDALLKGLREDDPCLISGRTSEPPAYDANRHKTPSACCLIAYPYWRTTPGMTVEALHDAMGDACIRAKALAGDHVYRLLAAWDSDENHAAFRKEVLAEVESYAGAL